MSIYRRGKRWGVVIEGERRDGKRARRFIGSFETKSEAQRAERRAKSERDQGIDVAPSSATVSQLMGRYIHLKAAECEERTIERYRELARLHISEPFGSVLIRKLRPLAVQEHYARLLRSGLSARTVHHVHALFRAAFAWGVSKELLARSPFVAVEGPVVRPTEAHHLTPEEVDAILDAAEGTRWHGPLSLSIATAARRGEIIALRWDAVDLVAAVVTIQSSMSDAGGKLRLKGTKSGRSRRIPLSETAVRALRSRRSQMLQDRLLAGPAYEDGGYVFADALGRSLVPDALTKAFKRFADKVGVPDATLHTLRHSAASWLLADGVDIRTVQAILGHSVASTTLNIYAHAVSGLQAKAVSSIDEKLEAAKRRRLG